MNKTFLSKTIAQLATRKERGSYSDPVFLEELRRREKLSVSELLTEIASIIEGGNPFDLIDGLYRDLEDRFQDFFLYSETRDKKYIEEFIRKFGDSHYSRRFYTDEDCTLLVSVMSPAILNKYASFFIGRAYTSRPFLLTYESIEEYFKSSICFFRSKLGKSFINLLCQIQEAFKPSHSDLYYETHSIIIKPLLYLCSTEDYLPSVLWDMVLDYYY